MSWLKCFPSKKNFNKLIGGWTGNLIYMYYKLTFWKRYGHEKYFSSLPCVFKRVFFKNTFVYTISTYSPLPLGSEKSKNTYRLLSIGSNVLSKNTIVYTISTECFSLGSEESCPRTQLYIQYEYLPLFLKNTIV